MANCLKSIKSCLNSMKQNKDYEFVSYEQQQTPEINRNMNVIDPIRPTEYSKIETNNNNFAKINLMKCCFLNDGHIAIEPITVSCGAIGCKQCLLNSNIEEIDCYSCKGKHKTQDLKKTPVIKPNENLIKSYVSDLFEYVKGILDKTATSLEGKIEWDIYLIINYLKFN